MPIEMICNLDAAAALDAILARHSDWTTGLRRYG